MADEDAKDKVETPVEETPQEQVTEPEAQAPAEVPAEETPEQEAPETEVEEPELTPNQQARVEEARAKGMDPLRLEKLIANMTRPKEQPPQQPQALDYRQALDADDEVVTALESDRQAFGEALYNQGLERARALEFRTMLEIDAPRVESKYPQLDPSSDEFDAQTASDINTLYLTISGYNQATGAAAPDYPRYGKFVDAFMATANAVAGKKVTESTKNVARQAAQTAIRPGGQSAKLNLNKEAHDMTDDELNAKYDSIIKSLKK